MTECTEKLSSVKLIKQYPETVYHRAYEIDPVVNLPYHICGVMVCDDLLK
jgi:hypothetical protein